jgi:hypothetical protein
MTCWLMQAAGQPGPGFSLPRGLHNEEDPPEDPEDRLDGQDVPSYYTTEMAERYAMVDACFCK